MSEWIPVSERLPKINQKVLLTSNEEIIYLGYRGKPALVWQVTEEDGHTSWVYDPEDYTDDIENLPKAEDCSFLFGGFGASMMSVASVNYDSNFEGIVAWMPLPEPYKETEE